MGNLRSSLDVRPVKVDSGVMEKSWGCNCGAALIEALAAQEGPDREATYL